MLCSADARYYAVLILYAVFLLYAVLCYAVLMLYAVFMLYAMLCYAQKCASEFSVSLCLCVSVLFTLFAGSWSDVHGRKALIVSSTLGYVFSNLIFMVNAHFFYELKAEYLLLEVRNSE